MLHYKSMFDMGYIRNILWAPPGEYTIFYNLNHQVSLVLRHIAGPTSRTNTADLDLNDNLSTYKTYDNIKNEKHRRLQQCKLL